jgi:hypothetical protein
LKKIREKTTRKLRYIKKKEEEKKRKRKEWSIEDTPKLILAHVRHHHKDFVKTNPTIPRKATISG